MGGKTKQFCSFESYQSFVNVAPNVASWSCKAEKLVPILIKSEKIMELEGGDVIIVVAVCFVVVIKRLYWVCNELYDVIKAGKSGDGDDGTVRGGLVIAIYCVEKYSWIA
jgi:hypothetical protein